MVTTPDSSSAENSQPAISERTERYRREIQQLVELGIEHPRCELTQQASISKENSKARADFLKLVQGLANAHLREERWLVIGADRSGKAFVPLTNADEFDPANVQAVLEKYLHPVPNHEVFRLATDQGTEFIAVIVAAKQKRPVVARTDAKDHEGKVIIRKSDVWIKEGTGLRLASGEDFQAIIRENTEAEAESLARSRFAHFRDEIVVTQQLYQPTGRRIPTNDLIFGKDETFRLYVRDLLVTTDSARFLMLIELLRDLLIEGWNQIGGYSNDAAEYDGDLRKSALRHKTEIFLPTLRRLIELGILIIKHEADGAWFAKASDLLVETFDSATRLSRLSAFEAVPVLEPYFEPFVGQRMPRVESWIAARVLAAYAMKRKRYRYVSPLLKALIALQRVDKRIRRPLLFWGHASQIEMQKGYTSFCWTRRVENSLSDYFGDREEFVQASCDLEFVLEFNSYVGMGNAGNTAVQHLAKVAADVLFQYIPDIYQYGVERTTTFAESWVDALRRSPQDVTVQELSVFPSVFASLLPNQSDEARVALAGGYLDYLSGMQSDFDRRRFYLRSASWGEKLGTILESYRRTKTKE